VGRAGTGKTILALAAGLDKVFEDAGRYNRLLITRPIVPLGNDLGYLPGDKEEKIRPWMQPIYDNLELLCNEHIRPNASINYLLSSGKIELEPLTYIRGRSIPRQFIICDESQNLSPHVIKTILTRIGKGSKIVFTGDPEQIDHPYLDSSSNGLSYLVERIRQEEISGHITLVKGERSGVAELGARLL
jgi:PhoH-like ATPase